MLTATLQSDRVIHEIKAHRIESIDLLRGIVMIIMALDHVRDYFHADAFLYNPLALDKTTAPIFFMRWITHFCAPVFVFLAGTSAFLVGKKKGLKALSVFLLTRGIWLVILENTIMNFAWFFNITFSLIVLQVIWALGMGMIILAALVRLPLTVNLILGIALVAGHNFLDGIHFEGSDTIAIGWAMLHEFAPFRIGNSVLFVGYPIIPWTGIMILGYCFGTWYTSDVSFSARKKRLLLLGAGMIGLFIVLRFFNIYGNPRPWTTQKDLLFTFMSFINVNKYPPSLLYTLITLGPAMIALALFENVRGKIVSYVVALGRVPLFYYILHVYLIHLIAIVAALLTGYEFSDMIFNTWVTDSPNLVGYGFSIEIVFLIWIAIVLMLFPVCIWYDRYKTANRHKKWLSYL